MEFIVQNILYIHIFVGFTALISGAIAISSTKGKGLHKKAGRIYFWAMTAVFITGIIVAGYRMNRFLFFIAFLSYYSVFAGVRILKLKKLHKNQRPEWFDWLAGIINTIANVGYLILGFYFLLYSDIKLGGILLTFGFAIGGLLLSYINIEPFIRRPTESYHWYLSHIGNMMGGYIATFTAFLSTMNSTLDLINPFLAFALPSLIGVPALIYWQKRTIASYSK